MLLMLNEKLEIATFWENSLLNKKKNKKTTELISKWRHQNKHMLS